MTETIVFIVVFVLISLVSGAMRMSTIESRREQKELEARK